MTGLMQVDRALELVLSHISLLPAETVDLSKALGRVLAEDVYSQTDLPSGDSAAMDGYAVRVADTRGANRDSAITLTVVMDIPAGVIPSQPLAEGQTAQIVTGAVMPDNADAVVPVEDTDSLWDAGQAAPLAQQVRVFRCLSPGHHVRRRGSDLQAGIRVLKSSTRLRPQEVGMLASLGYARVETYRRPRVVILSHGDELIDVEQELVPGKVRDANRYVLAGLVEECGAEPINLPIARDTPEEIRDLFIAALAHQPDMVVSSGGISVGVSDFVRNVLNELGTVSFWRVNLRPGKPVAFGHLRGIPFFGLPGNPVSMMVTFDVFVRPALFKQSGREDGPCIVNAVVAEVVTSDGRRSHLRVTLEYKDGQLLARSIGSQSSSTLMSMVLADSLLIVPENSAGIIVSGTVVTAARRRCCFTGFGERDS